MNAKTTITTTAWVALLTVSLLVFYNGATFAGEYGFEGTKYDKSIVVYYTTNGDDGESNIPGNYST